MTNQSCIDQVMTLVQHALILFSSILSFRNLLILQSPANTQSPAVISCNLKTIQLEICKKLS